MPLPQSYRRVSALKLHDPGRQSQPAFLSARPRKATLSALSRWPVSELPCNRQSAPDLHILAIACQALAVAP